MSGISWTAVSLQLAALLVPSAQSLQVSQPFTSRRPLQELVRSPATCAMLTDSPKEVPGAEALLGVVLSGCDGLITIKPERRELARVGTMLRFGGGGLGAIVAERCGLYFAASIEGEMPCSSEEVTLLPSNLTVPTWDGSAATWGGLHDFLGRPVDAPALTTEPVDVFADPVSAARRRPIGSSLHTGVVAIDALAPIGRGQSMMLFGPDSLPEGACCAHTACACRAPLRARMLPLPIPPLLPPSLPLRAVSTRALAVRVLLPRRAPSRPL